MGTVIAFGFVALRQPDKQHGNLGVPRGGHRFFGQAVVGLVAVDLKPLRVAQRAFGARRHGIKRGIDPCRIDVGAATALKAGALGKFTDHGHLLMGSQGQYLLVFKQHHALTSGLTRQLVMGLHIRRGLRAMLINASENQRQ